MRLTIIAFALVCAGPAFAKAPQGTDLASPEHAWWECLTQPDTHVICCSEADGHVLKDDDWRLQDTDKGPVYQIRVEGTWFNVPATKVVNETAQCGPEPNPEHRSMAKVWYSPVNVGQQIVDINIYCFMAGTMY